jgi:tetratricopeptide (TPR) repeat protein
MLQSGANPTDRQGASLAARIWISIALSEAETRGIDHGLAALDQAQRFASAAADPEVDVLLRCQRGGINIRSRALDAALAEFTAAFALFDHAGPRDQCVILLNRGTTYLYLGQLAKARTDLARAAERARSIDDRIREFKARHNLGYVEFIAGNLPLALSVMQDALNLNAPMSRGVAMLDRARVLMEAGLTRDADATLAVAGQIFAAEGRRHELGESLLARGECALIAGDVRSARALAGAARDRFRRAGNAGWRRGAELILLQADIAAGRPGLRLIKPAQRLQEELDGEGLRLPARTAGLLAAEAWLAAGNPTLAAAVLAALPSARRTDPVTTRLQGRYVLARVALAERERRVASHQIRQGLRELADHQASFGSIDLRAAAAVHGRQLAELDVQIALTVGPAATFAAAERARAVSNRLPAVRPPADPRTAELLAELRQTVESLRAPEQDRAAAAPLHRRRRELEREITARRWTLVGAGSARRASSLAAVRDRLRAADSTMVTYVTAGGVLHAVVTAPHRLRLVPLGEVGPIAELIHRARADLDGLANPLLPTGLLLAVQASFARSRAALDDLLIRPLHAGGRLVLVTTGMLGQLPWAELPSLREVPVVLAPSATAWVAASEPSTDPARCVVAIAGPGLARAADEVGSLAARRPGARVLTGAQATGGAVVAALTSADLVHVAAHGVHQTENPMFSSLRLVDGPLFAHELDGAAATAKHVVLSACELGLATVRPGDEALGLTSVLLQLGTRCVVAGVARVGDDAAAEAMTRYHRKLADGKDSAEALALAVAADRGGRPAPFACFGAAHTPL